MTAYAYYPGCTLHSSAREYDASARQVCQATGIELEELEDWVCCGGSSAHSMDRVLGLELPAHTLQSANEKGAPLAVACAMCFWRLKMTAHELAGTAVSQRAEASQGAVGNRPVEVFHLLQILEERKDILEVKKPLTGLKVACYYGCLLVRPHDILQFDDEENPTIMDRLIRCTGAETLDWSAKTECCGASLALARPDILLEMAHHVLSQAKEAGADCLAVACPMCHSNLDTRQKEMKARYAGHVDTAVFYFTQLLGLALGFPPKALLLDKHFTDTLPFLKAKGLLEERNG